jgi:hypothetical protein
MSAPRLEAWIIAVVAGIIGFALGLATMVVLAYLAIRWTT